MDQRTEAGFRLLFISNPQPMWVHDSKSLQFLEVNDAAIAHYGYSRDEFLRMRITDIRRPQDSSAQLENATGGLPFQQPGQWTHTCKNGQTIDVEIISRTVDFSGQEAELAVITDVTERKKSEEALRNAESKYRRIYEDAMIGLFQSSPSGRYISVNTAMARMLGYSSADELSKGMNDISQQLYVDPERRKEFRLLLELNGSVQNFECQVYRKDKTKMWLLVNARAVLENGVVLYYEGTNEDITERKLLEEQLRQSQKMEAVGRLAGGVAHDFNNALGVISGYSELMLADLPAGHVLEKYAQEIAKAGRRAAGLTRQLLAFSRKQVIQPVVLDLNSLIGEMDTMLRRLIGEDIEVIFTRHSALCRIKTDPGQIEQILMNLAVNARDAMPRGGKLIIGTADVQLDETYALQNAGAKPGRYAELSFSDTGCGMDRETQAHIFEPFFTTKEVGKGTGLGLSTVYGIVKQSGGHIRVYSEPGKGTNFKIYFPLAQGLGEPAHAMHTPSLPPRGSETILLVEDEEALRQLARKCLETSGYSVLEAHNGLAAIEVAKQHKSEIHLLLTDLVMPGMSGRELAERMFLLRPEMRVLYMSGYSNELIAQHGMLEAGIVFLEKPFTLHALLTKVRQALQNSLGAKAASAGG
jgi:two-component system cell cycle sensor histidine kinase/response regulator CckA